MPTIFRPGRPGRPRLPATMAAVLSTALLCVALPVVPAETADERGKEKKETTWDKLPSEGQVDRVTVKRVTPKKGEESASINAEVAYRLGEKSRTYLPPGPKTGSQKAAGGAARARFTQRREVDLGQLAKDWKAYAEDVAASDRIVRYAAGRSRQVLSFTKPDVSKLDYGNGFPLDKEVRLEPYYRGVPERALAGRQKLIHNSLMITDLKVVNDERARGLGKWSFGHLMRQLANEKETGLRPEEFTRRWLRHWEDDQKVAGFTVPNRKAGMEKFLAGWPKKDGHLDLDKAPFRLLAIVSRLDLRNNLVLGSERVGGGGAGEGRFVYCALDGDGNDPKSNPLAFTVIFEFQIKRNDFEGVRHWATQWYNLSLKKLGEPEYLAALEGLTDQFAEANADPESPPNRSALAALRTNEIALDLLSDEPFAAQVPKSPPVPLWEIREFRLDSHGGGHLRQVTAKQTPQLRFDDSDRLADFINGQKDVILAKSHRTPVEFPPGRPFLDGASITPVNQFWKASKVSDGEARHLFSLGTCSGCHAAETFPKVNVDTFAGDLLSADQKPPMFTHVRPRQHDKEAQVSPFLSGVGGQDLMLDDPAGQMEGGKVKQRPFGDLRRRADDLHALVHYGWYYELHRLPIQFVH